MVSTDLQTHMVSLSEIVPYAGNAKEHPEWQVDQIAASIERLNGMPTKTEYLRRLIREDMARETA